MEYDLTPIERQKYFQARGKTIVTACPGSGKTTSIVYKLRHLSAEIEKKNKHAGVICLSFTNKAVDEIKGAYYRMHGCYITYPHEVTTIDSFITQNILLPFWYTYLPCKVSPIIINDKELLHSVLWRQIEEDGRPREVCNIKGFERIAHSIKPEDINYCSRNYYDGIRLLSPEHNQYASKVIEYRLRHGYLTSSDVMMVSLEILKSNPQVAQSIVNRYPYFIIDEAQDTSYDQYCFLGELFKAGLENVELVGDVNQSIYEWRFAKPEWLEKVTEKKDWTHIPFSHNRRSVQRIIDLYAILVPWNRRIPIVSTGVEDMNIPIVVYRYNSTNHQNVVSDFEQRCKTNNLHQWLILTRGHGLGRILSETKEVPVYWKSKIPWMIIKAQQDFYYGKISAAVQQIAFVYGLLKYGQSSYKEIREAVKTVMINSEQSTAIVKALSRMPDFSETFQSWTQKMSVFLKKELELEQEPLFNVYTRKRHVEINAIASTPLSKYFDNVKDDKEYGRSVQTIHSSKGASTDAVLLFLSSDSRGNNISMNQFVSTDKMDEKQRLIYVACSRARQFLALAVPIEYSDVKLKSVLKGVVFEECVPGLIGGLF